MFSIFRSLSKKARQWKNNRVFSWVVSGLLAIITALVVLSLLTSSSLGLGWLAWHFAPANQSQYQHQNLLFYQADCRYCTQVDTFIANHQLQKVFPVTNIDVAAGANKSILNDKAQTCGLDLQKIGVPFLWDDKDQKCFLGYSDIIAFLQNKVPKK